MIASLGVGEFFDSPNVVRAAARLRMCILVYRSPPLVNKCLYCHRAAVFATGGTGADRCFNALLQLARSRPGGDAVPRRRPVPEPGPNRQRTVYPPSAVTAAPVTKDDSSLARNRATLASSDGSAMRRCGTAFLTASMYSAGMCRVIPVSTGPGSIALTRMPCAAYSAAAVRVICSAA